jgi:hypothetical protein
MVMTYIAKKKMAREQYTFQLNVIIIWHTEKNGDFENGMLKKYIYRKRRKIIFNRYERQIYVSSESKYDRKKMIRGFFFTGQQSFECLSYHWRNLYQLQFFVDQSNLFVIWVSSWVFFLTNFDKI